MIAIRNRLFLNTPPEVLAHPGRGSVAEPRPSASCLPRTLPALFLFLALAAPLPAADALRAGAFEVDITPRTFPIDTSGQFMAKSAKQALDKLHVRAVVLDDGLTRLALTVADSLMIPRELLDRVKQRAASRSGIRPERMMISATHTHTAPPVMGALGTDANPEYERLFEDAVVECIERAAAALQPARVGWTVVDVPDHTHCRRWILRPDRIRKDPFGDLSMRVNMHPGYQNPDFVGPSGPVDPALSMISVQTAAGRPLALLANYSMHYVGATQVSADYFGVFAAEMKRLIAPEDPGFVAIMSQGTSGDQQWMDYSRPLMRKPNPDEYGREVAAIALAAYQKVEYRSQAPLAMAQTTLRLSRRLPDYRRLEWAKNLLAAMAGKPPSNQAEVYAREQLLLVAAPERELILQAVRIGDLGITAIPDEVFALTGLELKARSPLTPTINVELANGAEGYIPPPEQHKLGGYTTWPARTAGLEVQAEPRILEGVLGLLEQVAGKPRRAQAPSEGVYAKAVLAAKPLAYWRGSQFRGSSEPDVSGHGNNAAYEGGVAFYLDGPDSPAFSAGQSNRAPHFAGGHMKASPKGLPASYTAELWVYNGLPADARPLTGVLLARGSESLAIGGSGARIGTLVVLGRWRRAGRSNGDPLKTWTYIALVRDKGRVRVYVNGSRAPEIAGDVAGVAPVDVELFLAGKPGAGESLEGRLDEIAVYPRVVKGDELAAHYSLVRASR